jgi:outer membrane protein OmpA-like peptidoglycan-associated protein
MVEIIDTIEVDEPYVTKEIVKRPKEMNEKKNMNETIFFKIAQSDADKATGVDEAIKKVAELMKTSDDAIFTVTGYADKGTGSSKANQKYAKLRAEDVTKKLINEHGIDAARIKTDSKGDTVQPFEENDKNRCVIITGEGTFKVTVYEDVEVEKKETRKVKKVRVRQEEVKERVD